MRKPLIWIGGLVIAAAIATLAAFFVIQKPSLPIPVIKPALTKLLIPEAHAADAFSLVAEKSDAAGAAVDTNFKLTSKVETNAGTIKKVLRVVPEVPVEIEQVASNEFRVKPEAALKPGTVYRLALAANVQKGDGSEAVREFSWAVQTKNVFRVLNSIPGDESEGVPVESVIEVTLSQTGWEDPKPYFSTEPKVEGRFETHGRAFYLITNKPLQPGQIYTVTYKKGWKIADSDLELQKDHVIRFETLAPELAKEKRVLKLEPSGTFFESAPNKETFIQTYYGVNLSDFKDPIKLTGFALSKDDAKNLITEVNAVPWWARVTREKGQVYEKFAKTQAFEVTGALESAGGWQTFLRVPAQKSGIYLVRIIPGIANETTEVQNTWFVLQVTNLASYAMSDVKDSLLWVMNVDTQRPLSNQPVQVEGQEFKTDESGLARFPTPAALSSTSTLQATAILEVGSGELSALVPLLKGGYGWDFGYGWGRPGNDLNISYLFLDRPLYCNTDKIMFFGFAQDRDARKPLGQYKMLLRKPGWFDYASYSDKIYAERTISPDESGFFRGDIDWQNLAAGFYQLVLVRDGQEIESRHFEVRNIVKPAYTIDVVPDQKAIFAGEAITGKIKVTHFDGAPVARLKLTADTHGPYDQESVEITTDDAGMASFNFKTNRQSCDLSQKYVYCGSFWSDSLEVRPVQAEEAEITGYAYVSIWAARINTEVKTETKDNTAELSFFVRRVTPNAEQVFGDPVGAINISGRVIERRWETVELEPVYDYIEKKVSPSYRYELKERDVMTVNLTTDSGGRAKLSVPMADNVSYYLVATAKDEQGAEEVVTRSFAKGWYTPYVTESVRTGNNYSFDPTIPRDSTSYKLDEEVSLTVFNNEVKLPDRDTPSFLFVETMRGLKKATALSRSTYTFRYQDDLVPNATIYAVIFGPGGFTELSYTADFDDKTRELKIQITPDQPAYAPGAKVTAKVKVTAEDGAAAKAARVGLSAVDEALLAIYGEFEQPPLPSLYAWVSNGVIYTRSSHGALAEAFRAGGAEMGGGGGDGVRRNFKDTAAFDVLTTDENGEATFSFTAPDNLTSWRLVASALTSNLYGGTGRANVVVTKPVFVDVVIPQTLLLKDKPVLKLRAFGAGLRLGQALNFTVDAPSLGIQQQSVTGTVGAPVYVAIDNLAAGEHTVILRVQAGDKTDALERKVRVLPSRFTKDELVSSELVPGASLPDPGNLPEVEVMFSSLTQTRYLPNLQALSYPWSARVEAKLAARVARDLLRDVYGQKDIPAGDNLLQYQRERGGVAILPYASEDVELSAKVAATIPEAFDQGKLANYLWSVADNKEVTREEAIRALSGLAALREPVLVRLQRFVGEKDLNWRETLALARGLEAAGDREAARSILEKLLGTSEERDGLIRLTVAEDERSVMEATAEAAALAASLFHPKAKGLDAYLEKNWAKDVLSDLDRAYYLKHVIPTLAAGDVTIKYTLGTDEKSIEIKNGWSEYLILTNAEAKSFKVTSVSGPAAASFMRRTPGLPATVPEVSLTREYTVVDGLLDNLTEGATVNVILKPAWKENAQDGCYMVRDRLPSGLTPVQTLIYDFYSPLDRVWYPTEVESQEIGFVACKSQESQAISYRARVVSRGTYLAEPASLQSMDAPAVTALSDEKTVTIK